MNQTQYCLFETPLGSCGIAWRDAAVTLFQLPEQTAKLTESRIARKSGAAKSSPPPSEIAQIIGKVRKHLDGQVQDFTTVRVDLGAAAPFARMVYQAARDIPAGRTMTYGQLAGALGRPGAARAVGQALGANPITLIIPCHRVLAAGGRGGGFSAHGGIATKAKMLACEGATLGPPPTVKSAADLRRAADHLKSKDPRLARCLAGPIEFRLKPGHAPYATLFEAIVHQQLSPKAAQTILGRVKALYPRSTIPEPADLLKTPAARLRKAGLSRSKATALKDLAARTLDGTVPSAQQIVSLADEEIIRRLSSIHGIGRWTVEMLLIFNLGRADVLPVDDYALRRGAAAVFGMKDLPTPKQLAALGEAWRPHRTTASLYLWNSLKPGATA